MPQATDILDWTDKTRMKIVAANKGKQEDTLKALLALEKAARKGDPCPACPEKFSKMNIKLALALNKLAK
eukprot:5237352-Amphidinium_carterae.1